MKIGIGVDHRGFIKKQFVIDFLSEKGYDVIDYGTDNNESVDYPDFAFKVAEDVRDKKLNYGIVMCANGIGVSIAANKVKKVRCAKVSNVDEARHSRLDNDCNMIALGSDLEDELIKEILTAFLKTEFKGEERFIRRIGKLDNYDD